MADETISLEIKLESDQVKSELRKIDDLGKKLQETLDGVDLSKAIKSLKDLRENKLAGNTTPERTNYVSRKLEFDKKIESLITELEKASKKDIDK